MVMESLYNSVVESSFFKDNYQLDKLLIPASFALGISAGLLIPGADDLSPFARVASSVMGWTYFFSWAISFWPQVVTNYYKETTEGLAADKYIFDLVGFIALAMYECFMYWDGATRKEYAEQHDGKRPEVEINDVWFALHSLLLTFIVIYQILLYDGYNNPPSKASQYICGILTLVCVVTYIGYNFWSTIVPIFSWLNWLYVLSTVKVIITCMKFFPQVMLNYKRKATRGWNIYGTWLDLTGAVLSCAQLIADSADRNDFNGISGNLVKLLLGVVSGAYDIIFIVQHYYLYPGTGDDFSITGMEKIINSPKPTPKQLKIFLKVRGHRLQYNDVIARLQAEFNITDEEAQLLQKGVVLGRGAKNYGTQYGTDDVHLNDSFALARENSLIGGRYVNQEDQSYISTGRGQETQRGRTETA